MPSRRFAAVLDLLLDAPEAAQVLALKGGRRSRSLASRAGRWCRRRLAQARPLPAPAMAAASQSPATAGAPQTPLPLEPQRCLLVRIIGNDLYPRHDAGQSLQNLRFILEHEPALPGCEKRWLLNRIRQPERLRELIGLLEAHGYGYDVIPFDAAAFAAVPWDWATLPAADFLASRAFLRLLNHQRLGWELAFYRHKNNYLMHNNGARNRALELGRSRADWILPWDGNCFLTAAGWQAIRGALADHPGADYFHVPMQRVADNADLLDPAFAADPRDEPQLLFAARAPEAFNPAFPYGRRPKVELFWRLGLPGLWDHWPDEPWDPPRRPRLEPAPACPRAGWVARLHSGVRGGEAAGSAVLSQQGRHGARNLAIKASINQALQAGVGALCPSAFHAFWQGGGAEDGRQAAAAARAVLGRWWGWWSAGSAVPEATAEQLVSAFCQLHWQWLLAPSPDPQDAALLAGIAGVWFAPGPAGLQPRLRLLRRPLRCGRLAGTAPTIGLALQLALLADLLVWQALPSRSTGLADGSAARAISWCDPVLGWCDRFGAHLQALVNPAWLRDRLPNQQRLHLTLALLQRHRGHPTAAADALLRLLAFHHPEGSIPRAAAPDPALRSLSLALASEHGLVDPALADQFAWPPVDPAQRQPLPPLASLPPA